MEPKSIAEVQRRLNIPEPPPDNVSKPKHYTRFSIEPIDFILKNGLSFWQGNIIKYILRYDAKNGVEDLLKARQYLDRQIELLRERTPPQNALAELIRRAEGSN